ncbi:MAG: exosortase E/protease, VPEID-CTERM system [Planctomycetes bacterium]|nr:exosortase E/protease, VPEID-CTERM system [Planctomycetota bacterium]
MSHVRALALLTLLAAQGLIIGVRYDSAALERFGPGWWTPLVAAAGWSMSAAASLLAALALVGSSEARRTREPAPWRLPHRCARFVALELAAFAGWVALAEALFDPERALTAPGAWFAGALALAALGAAAWLAALVPVRELAPFARRHATAFGAALVLGSLAFGVGRAAQDLWLPLRRATLAAAHALLAAFEPSASAHPSDLVLAAGDFAVRVEPACSGYEGIGLAVVFVLASFVLFRDAWRFSRAWLLLPLAALAAWSANVVRLAALVWLGARVSPELALGGFHSYAGTVLFCAASLATVALALRSPWFARVEPRAGPNPAAPYLVPLLASLAAALVSRAFASADAEPLFALRVAVAAGALAAFVGTYRRWDWRPSGVALVVGAALALGWAGLAELEASAEPAPRPAAFELALRIAYALALVPLFEELAFRGFLARRIGALEFERADPTRLGIAGIVVSSFAFGVLHQRVIAGTLAGIAYALVYRRRGRLADAVWAHATTNAVLVVIAAKNGDWSLWK